MTVLGHILLKEQDNDCRTALTWALEERSKQGRSKASRRRTVERERDS